MGLGTWIKRAFAPPRRLHEPDYRLMRRDRQPAREPAPKDPAGPSTVRRFESAQTNRLNQSRWSRATGTPINQDLAAYLETIRTRAIYEAANNPTIEGMINTHVADVVGRHGPTLQINTENVPYARAREAVWRAWWSRPCTNRTLSGVTRLRQWVRNYWTCGEFFDQLVTKDDYDGPVKLRLLPIHPRRIAAGPTAAADPNVVLGIRFTEDGDPIAYFVQKFTRFGAYALAAGDSQEVAAAAMLHGFHPTEEDQARGIPWLNSALPVAAQLRDYDQTELNAAHNAARQATWLYSDHYDAPFLEINETAEVEEGDFVSTCPPGWKPMQLQAAHPTAQYQVFREERMRDIGRPAGMPLMMIRLDSSRHNYSSARFDGQSYARQTGTFQAHLEDVGLDRLESAVAREAELAGRLPPPPPDVTRQWTWPVLPHVDPEKEANADTAEMENRTLSWSEAVIANGRDPDDVIEQHRRDAKRFQAAGLPLPPSLAEPAQKPKTPPPAAAGKSDGWAAAKANGDLVHA